MTDWYKQKIEALVAACNSAVSRARFTFLACNVATVMILVTIFNSLFPWLRKTLSRGLDPTSEYYPEIKRALVETVYHELQMTQLPLLGLKISACDVSLLGATAMAILSVWYFFSLRRENHVVRAISHEFQSALKDISADGINKASYIYNAVAHYFVFTTATEDDTPGDQSSAAFPLARAAQSILHELIWLVSAFNIVWDLYSVFVEQEVSTGRGILWLRMRPDEHIEIVLRWVVATFFIGYTFMVVRRCVGFQADTRETLRAMNKDLEEALPKTSKTASAPRAVGALPIGRD